MNAGLALLLAAGAGFSTTIGSLLGLSVKNPGPRFMSFTLGFSAGIMIFVSFVELLPQALKTPGIGFLDAHLALFGGVGVYFLIDRWIPHEYMGQIEADAPRKALEGNGALRRAGMLVALGIAIHNFPEGMATFIGTLEDANLGMAIALAIAIHNIPEGLAIAVPVLAATGNRKRAFLWSFLSGVSEVLGAGVAALFLLPFLTPVLLGYVLSAVAGIMILISVDELIPTAKSLTAETMPLTGFITGMAVMTLSLWLLK